MAYCHAYTCMRFVKALRAGLIVAGKTRLAKFVNASVARIAAERQTYLPDDCLSYTQ